MREKVHFDDLEKSYAGEAFMSPAYKGTCSFCGHMTYFEGILFTISDVFYDVEDRVLYYLARVLNDLYCVHCAAKIEMVQLWRPTPNQVLEESHWSQIASGRLN